MQLAQFLTDVNWLAVIIATVSAFILGGLWYSKALFGNAWMQEVGLTEESVNNANIAKTLGSTFALQIIAATALSALVRDGSTWMDGLQTGLWVGLFWIGTAYAVTYLFEQRSFRLWLINAGYYVVLYTLMGTIIGALR